MSNIQISCIAYRTAFEKKIDFEPHFILSFKRHLILIRLKNCMEKYTGIGFGLYNIEKRYDICSSFIMSTTCHCTKVTIVKKSE